MLYTLVWCSQGSCTVYVDDKALVIRADDILTITSGQVFYFINIDEAVGLILQLSFDFLCKDEQAIEFLSFKDNVGTGFVFRDFSYIYNSGKSRKGNSFLVINNFEVSGWEVYLTNQLYNVISGDNSQWSISRGNLLNRNISFAKYIRYEVDGRHYKDFSKTRSLASRLNLGIIVPFGENAASSIYKTIWGRWT